MQNTRKKTEQWQKQRRAPRSTKKHQVITKKKVAKKREIDVFSLESMQNRICQRNGIAKLPRQSDGWPKSHRANKLDRLRLNVEAFDKARLLELKQAVKYRRQIFARIPKLEKMLKAEFGAQIWVWTHLTQLDEIRVEVVFRPKKGQHPFDADKCVGESFEKSGLLKYMDHSGSGTICGGEDDGLRDHDYTERKYSPED